MESLAQYWTVAAWLLERTPTGNLKATWTPAWRKWALSCDLGDPMSNKALKMRDTNETAWRWEYLGEITGTGGAVFDNVHDARLSNSRILAVGIVASVRFQPAGQHLHLPHIRHW